MGRNNLEDRSHDVNWGYNITRNTTFKFELMPDAYTRRIELSAGLEMYKLTRSIKVNSKYELKEKDKVRIKGRDYTITWSQGVEDNELQGKYKASIGDFTGHCVYGLE